MAIAFDAKSVSSLVTTANSITFAHTVTGTNPILYVGVFGDLNNDYVTGVTYNSVSMTLSGKQRETSGRWNYLFRLVGPSTGSAYNVVVTASSNMDAAMAVASSYTAAKQTGQPDATGGGVGGGPVAGVTGTVTVVTADCWTVGMFKNESGAATVSTGTARENNANGLAFIDSGALVAPGARTLATSAPSTEWSWVMESFLPDTATGGGSTGAVVQHLRNLGVY